MTTARSVLDLMRGSPLVGLNGRRCSRPRAGLWAKMELALPGQMELVGHAGRGAGTGGGGQRVPPRDRH